MSWDTYLHIDRCPGIKKIKATHHVSATSVNYPTNVFVHQRQTQVGRCSKRPRIILEWQLSHVFLTSFKCEVLEDKETHTHTLTLTLCLARPPCRSCVRVNVLHPAPHWAVSHHHHYHPLSQIGHTYTINNYSLVLNVFKCLKYVTGPSGTLLGGVASLCLG